MDSEGGQTRPQGLSLGKGSAEIVRKELEVLWQDMIAFAQPYQHARQASFLNAAALNNLSETSDAERQENGLKLRGRLSCVIHLRVARCFQGIAGGLLNSGCLMLATLDDVLQHAFIDSSDITFRTLLVQMKRANDVKLAFISENETRTWIEEIFGKVVADFSNACANAETNEPPRIEYGFTITDETLQLSTTQDLECVAHAKAVSSIYASDTAQISETPQGGYEIRAMYSISNTGKDSEKWESLNSRAGRKQELLVESSWLATAVPGSHITNSPTGANMALSLGPSFWPEVVYREGLSAPNAYRDYWRQLGMYQEQQYWCVGKDGYASFVYRYDRSQSKLQQILGSAPFRPRFLRLGVATRPSTSVAQPTSVYQSTM